MADELRATLEVETPVTVPTDHEMTVEVGWVLARTRLAELPL